MNEAPLIRPYHPHDKVALLDLLTLLVPTYFAEEEIADFKDYLDQKIELYFVAERQGKILAAGGINFESDKGLGKLSWDFVHPDEQGKGVGKKLLTYRIDLLKGMSDMRSISVRTSQLAYLFYQKHGFELVEIQKDYWAPGLDLYAMVYREVFDKTAK
ncbi:GNAT family N-acetyltransferase [Sphingobacterium paludis]|uniref:N-acetylglutamate synthase-like GNAT family acetyltransferase n=1 Tax=Sphingobacterium paludis TaxID=1476465 RepID=A0A4R7CWG0_9SPHI|nr:GNAT family N-acetyltransferase [Sphingobacterium paludis]TDS12197.1 N-acetylglutamate synthase-like GNAT family acetyltransferase [Sphingobacterium paludis]